MPSSSVAVRLPLLPRGVWEADYLVRGCRVLQAIDRDGNCRKRIRLRPDIDEDVARAWLEGFLERIDPETRLKLIVVPPEPRLAPGVFAALITARSASFRAVRASAALPATP